MGKIQLDALMANTNSIPVFEIAETFPLQGFFAFRPMWTSLCIIISPHVLLQMLKWLKQNHYIELDGTLTIKVRTKGVTFNEPTKEEMDETKSSTGVSTPNESH